VVGDSKEHVQEKVETDEDEYEEEDAIKPAFLYSRHPEMTIFHKC
jgi:hypothetical protein